MFRKIAPWYAKRFGPANVFNKRVVRLATRAEFHALLADYTQWRRQFLDDHGELLPRFQQPPMVASFMQDAPAVAQRQNIPVRKGRWKFGKISEFRLYVPRLRTISCAELCLQNPPTEGRMTT